MQNSNYAKRQIANTTDQPKLEDNLLSWSKIGRYSQWMYNIYKPFVGKRILDIGVGVGNMMQFYTKQAEIAIGADIFDSQLKIVEERFTGYPIKTIVLDIEKDDISSLKEYKLDTIICINVLEHIQNDLQALLNMKEILADGGVIVLLVPANNRLYNYMDENAGHYRRYEKGQLCLLAEKANMKILMHKHFNLFGIIPYYLKGKFGKQKKGTFSSTLNESNSKLYNIATCILEPFESFVKIPTGLSEIIVLKKH